MEARHPDLYRVLLAAMTDSDKSYLAYMAARVLELRRVMKPVGSIYLHCDDTMSHYLKLLMDAVFGRENFRNDICWIRNPGHSDSKGFGRVADHLLFYGAAIDKDAIREPIPPETIQQHYRHSDARGPYRPENLKTTGLSGGGTSMSFTDIAAHGAIRELGCWNWKMKGASTCPRSREACLSGSAI